MLAVSAGSTEPPWIASVPADRELALDPARCVQGGLSDAHARVYLMTQHLVKHPFLAIFDGPDTNVSTDVRESTVRCRRCT